MRQSEIRHANPSKTGEEARRKMKKPLLEALRFRYHQCPRCYALYVRDWLFLLWVTPIASIPAARNPYPQQASKHQHQCFLAQVLAE